MPSTVFAFHRAIADATGNPQFRRFLEYLGHLLSRAVQSELSAPVSKRAHLDLFQREHEQILRAIEHRSPAQARSAMQRHLLNSRARYEKLAAKSAKTGKPTPATRVSA